MMKTRFLSFLVVMAALCVNVAAGQQRIGYVDSEYILSQIPEYASIQQSLDREAQEMEEELSEMKAQIDAEFEQYRTRELLYTNAERERRRAEIIEMEERLENRRIELFGPEGRLFDRQEQLMQPLQERIFTAMEEVAVNEGFDYLFDISGDYLFMYAREDLNMSNTVLEELGINVADRNGAGSGDN